MATVAGYQYCSCVLIRYVSGEYHIINPSIFLILINKKFQNLPYFTSFKKFAFAEIYRVLFAGKSVKQFYRFTGKFSVKAQP
jgi:hypothetical protein